MNTNGLFWSARILCGALLVAAGCAGDDIADGSVDSGASDSAVGDSDVMPPRDGGDDATVDGAMPDAGPVCGDGVVGGGEECDDFGVLDGDGCDADCGVESGFSCRDEPSVCTETCGDSMLVGAETCDVGTPVAGDGCSDACQQESGWACTGMPSVCTETCGDSMIVGAETCDVGTPIAGDGCSDACQEESGWACTGMPSVCTETCGDSMIVGAETCDVGTPVAGDGCSDACQEESGWACTGMPSVCTETCGDSMIVGAETCDVGTPVAGDGCSDACQEESGWACTGMPSVCAETCGDSMVVGAETCDVGTPVVGDGCSDACQEESGWACTGTPSVCSTTCGDAIPAGTETCDDGNLLEDDGCSATCTTETGFGLGSDGDLVVTAPGPLPFSAVQVASATAGALTASIATTTQVGTLAVGDKVLLHQTRATTGSVGHFEYARIAAIAGSTITFEHPLADSYLSSGLTRAQLIRVYEYRNVTISAALFANDWNNLGQLGGILAFDAQGTITIASGGRLMMNSRGFHGHAKGCPLYQCISGTTGESYLGPGGGWTAANGSGGGAGGVGDDGAGGGGGGNGTAGQRGSAGICAGLDVCDAACPIPGGEAGLVSPGTVASALFFGGAGGMGGTDSEGARPGPGGYGGGIIAVRGAQIVVDGAISADGSAGRAGVSNDASCGGTGCGMGGGGGGAGGTVRLVARTAVDLGTNVVTADGGGRGLSTCGAVDGVGGGGGGAGRIGVSAPTVTGTTRPALTRF